MDDRGRIAISIGVGALVGGVAGYLLLTERGRDLRVNFEPRLNDLLREVEGLRTTFERTRSAVAEGLASFNQLVSDQPAGQPRAQARGPQASGAGAPGVGASGSTGQSASGQPATGPTLWNRTPAPGSTH